jgi:hypothetical protein
VIHIDLVTDMAMQKLLRREQRKIKDGAAATLVVFFQSKDCSWIRPDRIVALPANHHRTDQGPKGTILSRQSGKRNVPSDCYERMCKLHAVPVLFLDLKFVIFLTVLPVRAPPTLLLGAASLAKRRSSHCLHFG